MISNDSILRRLPVALDPKQALFIDGVRHAVEIAHFAYIRLGHTLADLALHDHESEVLASKTTSAFLDAWAIVDAMDRFCSLWKKLPNASPAQLPPGSKSIDDLYKPIRELRNVGDHLAKRADFVIAKKGSALGTLTWFTGLNQKPLAGWVCAIVPGIITQRSGGQFSDPFETSEEWPTRNIWLYAAGFGANLSEIFAHVQIRIQRLEESIEKAISRQAEFPTPANSDMLIKYKLSPGELQPKVIATAVGLRGETPEVAPGGWSLVVQHVKGNTEPQG